MEVARISETLVDFYQTTRRYNQKTAIIKALLVGVMVDLLFRFCFVLLRCVLVVISQNVESVRAGRL